MTYLAYAQALNRIEQLLTGSAMTDIPERRILWRDDAVAIADEWDLCYEMRRELMEAAHENAYMGRPIGADRA